MVHFKTNSNKCKLYLVCKIKLIVHMHTKEDGTLDIKYHLVWKVLDDKREGPLT